MGLLGAVKERLGGYGMARLILVELRRMNRLGEELIDELRLTNGRLPRYEKAPRVEAGWGKVDPPFEGTVLVDHDYAGDEYLRDYARMEGFHVDELTDIRTMAKDHGWVDEEGNLRV